MQPDISVIVCTRNRGNSVVATIDSILNNTLSSFELILVDQSTNRDTEIAIARFLTDPRFCYLPSHSTGASRARNIGMQTASGEYIACTDDDCTVSANWLEGLVSLFENNPRVGMIFTNVYEAVHNSQLGFIPSYKRKKDNMVRNLWDKCTAHGMGASMALRKKAINDIGYMDELLGPGALFPACEEGDLAVRALIHGWWVYETIQPSVVHYGFRTWLEGKELSRRNWIGIGAAYSKFLKCGHYEILCIILFEAIVIGFLKPLSQLLKLKRPKGIKSILYFIIGIFWGLRTPVNSKSILFSQD